VCLYLQTQKIKFEQNNAVFPRNSVKSVWMADRLNC
jgi:hypothetical protein